MSEANEFWERNPKGIAIQALFGDKGGAGEIGQAIKKLDASGDGYISKDEFRTGIADALKTAADNKNLKRIAKRDTVSPSARRSPRDDFCVIM